MKAAAVIPARYGSRRFPGKPLAMIHGKPMIQHVYEGARTSSRLSSIVIATDDDRIFQAARNFGAEAVMTDAGHTSGTHRVAEAAAAIEASIIVNIQGDEPLIKGDIIDLLIEALDNERFQLATPAAKNYDLSLIRNPGIVKVVTDHTGCALYFSRAPIPHGAKDYFWQHIGLYAYRKSILMSLDRIPDSRLSRIESLEQLKFLEAGHSIQVIPVESATISVDFPEDIEKITLHLSKEAHEKS